MRPPSKVRVAGMEFSIAGYPASEMGGNVGLCELGPQRISYARGQTPHQLRDTLVHEVMHAIRYSQGCLYEGPEEERWVRSLATGLVGVLADNPKFSRWLISGLTPPTNESSSDGN